MAAADEVIAGGIKDVEIILNGGEGHQAAHGEVFDIHEETEVTDIDDESGILGRVLHLQLRAEEGVHLHVFAVALGIGGVAFRLGDVVGGFLERMLFAVAGLEEGTMHHQVRVTADG